MLQYLMRVIRGQVLDWADHHNPVVTEIWKRVPLLPEGQQVIYKQLIVNSSLVIQALVGMNRGKQFPFAVDCRTINIDGYRQLFPILLSYFVFQLSLINPTLSQDLFESLVTVCGESEDQKHLLGRFRHVQALLTKKERRTPDIANLGHEVWQALRLKLKARNEPLDAIAFTAFATHVLNSGLENMK